MKTKKSTTRCAEKLKVLGDKVRLSVLELLMGGPKYVWQLQEALGVEETLLSHHLKTLRNEGLVRSTREGKALLYDLTEAAKDKRSRKAIDLGCCLLTFEK
jgi:DNA-binding HxlR family transcriptional regulator